VRPTVLYLSKHCCLCGLGARDLGQGVRGTARPDERFGVGVVMLHVLPDGLLQLSHVGKTGALDALIGNVPEKTLDHVQPRRTGVCEMYNKPRMLGQPIAHCPMLMRAIVIVIGNQMQRQILGRVAINQTQKLRPLNMGVALLTLADDLSVEHVERNKQRTHC